MRRLQYIIGLAGIVAFVLSGQVLRLHRPPMHTMPDGPRMVFVSRHIYLLCASLLNLALGMYVRIDTRGWRRPVQIAGSALVAAAPVLLAVAFLREPELGLAGRSAWSALGLFAMAGGILLHMTSRLKRTG